jgi:hypothetical protein
MLTVTARLAFHTLTLYQYHILTITLTLMRQTLTHQYYLVVGVTEMTEPAGDGQLQLMALRSSSIVRNYY